MTPAAKIQPASTCREGSRFWLFSPWSRVGHALRLICMLWLVKIWQVSTCGKCMQHLETCFLIAEADSFVSPTCHVFNWLFPQDVQNEYSCMLSRFFCNSWLVCLLDWCLRNAPLVKIIGNPIWYGIVFIFHLAWCVRGFKRLKWFWPYLMAFRSCIATGKPEWLFSWCGFFQVS